LGKLQSSFKAGFRTRIAAVLLAITCVVAVATAHSQEVFTISDHGGYALELLMLYLFGALALFFTGAGKYAVSKNNQWD
jgi:putative oxidoreductase